MIFSLQILVGLVLLVFGSDILVRGAAKLARLFGLSPFAIGLTVMAFGTSGPELFASVRAGLGGDGDLAIGNVVGSNIANVLLILGLTAAVRPLGVDRSVGRRDLPAMIAVSLIVSSVMLLGDRTIGRVEGAFLTVGLIVYVVFTWRTGKTDPDSLAHELEREVEEDLHLDSPEPRSRLALDLALIIAGLGMLTGGAELLVRGAVTLAKDILGVSPGIVGLTVVAFGTSLPEMAASVRAAVGKHASMALGNIVGSNVFNLLSVLGIGALTVPLSARPEVGLDIAVMLGATVLCYPVLSRRGLITRAQGAAMVTLYVGYIGYLAFQSLSSAA